MKRRETFKYLIAGAVGGTALATTAAGCKTNGVDDSTKAVKEKYYGRTPSEIEHDQKVNEEIF